MSKTNFGHFPKGHYVIRDILVLVTGLLILPLTQATSLTAADAASGFRSDFKAALQEAEEKQVPLLIHFYADWCMPCQRMEREVFTNPAVKEYLSSHVIPLKVNSDHRQDLVNRYGVQTLPSDVLIDPLNGRVIALNAGYQDRNAYVANASSAEAKFKKFHAAELAASKPASKSNPEASLTSKKNVEPELGEPRPVLGLDGFSPVALAKSRQWNRGSAAYAWDFKDVTYYLSSRDELVEFRSNPEAYAPKLLGCDPVILWESDKAVAGNIRFGAYFDNELYLFKSEDHRAQFKANPEKYIRLQHALKADEIENTVIR